MNNITDAWGFDCCFCNNKIKENKVDPIDINIILNEDMINRTGSSQNFYGHFECFKQCLHSTIQGYFVRDDD